MQMKLFTYMLAKYALKVLGCRKIKVATVCDVNGQNEMSSGVMDDPGEKRMKTMKSIIAICISVLANIAFAYTYSATVNGVTWKYSVINGYASVGTETTTAAIPTTTTGSISIPTKLGSYTVKYIGNYAFNGCSELTLVSIPNGVETIGSHAFESCSGLTSVSIPNSVISIVGYAFSNCSSLQRVYVPSSVKSIYSSAFSNCSSLVAFDVADGNSFYQSESGLLLSKDGKTLVCGVNGNVVVPSGVESIGGDSFHGLSGLTNVFIPNSVTNIGAGAFYYCTGLTSMAIPSSVTSIGESAFRGCSELNAIHLADIKSWCKIKFGSDMANPCYYAHTLYLNEDLITHFIVPDDITNIGRYVFYGCTNLTSVVLPTSVTNVEASAFEGCSGLISVTLPQCVSSMSSTFPSAYQRVNAVVLNDGVTNVASRMFAGCTGLCEVTMPPSVTSIGVNAFSGCSQFSRMNISDLEAWAQVAFGNAIGYSYEVYLNGVLLERLEIPDSITAIPDWVFAGCTSIEEVVLPEELEYIGTGAFQGCSNLSKVKLPLSPICLGNLDLRTIEVVGSQRINGFRVYNGWVIGYEDNSVSRLVVSDGVIGIAPYALSDLWDMEDVVLPESLKYIGCGAFMNDTYLESINIPEGAEYIDGEAFKNCTYLRNVTIGDGLRRIGREAFGNCSQLTALSMPDTVASIGDGVCLNCWRMTSVKLPLGLDGIGKGMFAKCASLVSAEVPTARFTMASMFEERYNKLTSASIIPGETDVCASAFEGCVSFQTIEIPEGITNCGDRAFFGCTNLTEIVLPDSVRTIGREIFMDCTGLRNVTLSRSLASIPDFAFYTTRAKHFLYAVVPPSVKHLGQYICYSYPTSSGNGGWRGLRFLGNAPEYDHAAYANAYGLTTYVVQGSRGWDGIPSSRDLPETWIGQPITFWTPTVFDANFNANGGKFDGGGTTVQCEEMTDTAFIIPTSAPTKIGHAFAGWWTAPDGGTQIKTTTRVSQTSEMTIYAHWTRVEEIVEVRFEPNDGTGSMPNQTFTYGEALALSPNQFVRAGYVFLGWSRTANGDVAYTDGEVIQNLTALGSGTVTLFAVWAIDSSNVTFAVDGDKAWGLARFARNGAVVWQSGAIGDNQNSVMEAHVRGSGAITFDWQASCEDSFRGMRLDYLAFHVDGVEKSFVNGSTEWATESFVIEGAGDHVLRWVYVKDSEGSNYDDCGRVSSVTWSPSLNSLGDFLNAPSVGFSTAGDALWSGQTTVSHDGVASLRSGAISDGGMTRLECAVSGPGEVSFWWKASCEAPFRGVPLDFVEFSVDGVQKEWIAGETDWTNAIVSVESAGRHVLAWTYQKDDWEGTSDGEDCAWVDEVSWTPAADADVTVDVGGGKFVIVPGTWLSEKTNKAATDAAANGRKVWECYVLGLDPEDETNDFKIVSFPMKADGTPDLDAMIIAPPKSQWNVNGATPVLKGKATLEGEGEWQTVTDENKAQMKFFKVEVVVP